MDRIQRASEFLLAHQAIPGKWCIVLGSGLGGISYHLISKGNQIPYDSIPGFPKTTIEGHRGSFTFHTFNNESIAIMEGRFHIYEGYHPQIVVLPFRVLMQLGYTHFFITNAAGGIHPDLQPGSIMIIRDHLNLMGANPLTGQNYDEYGPRFPAMTNAYDPIIRSLCRTGASNLSIPYIEGVYAALQGPYYETPAEIKMLQTLGADAVGMSTVPEVLAIRHAGNTVAAISLITNSTGADTIPTHTEVVKMAAKRKPLIHQLILDVIKTYSAKEVS